MASELAVKLRELSHAQALAHNLKFVNLTSVKTMKFAFNPFHDRVSSIREMIFQLTVPKRRHTNINCAIKVDVKSDRCDPTIEILFIDGHKALFKTQNLLPIDILKEFNRLCKVHEPQHVPAK